jgi:O-antigen/teichoic acid export membrane protein
LDVIAAVLFNFWPLRKRTSGMKFTPKKGVLRLVMVAVGILLGLPFAESFTFIVVCALVCIGWVLYELIGGFFDVD